VGIIWEKGCFPILRLRKQHILGGNNYLLKTQDCVKWYHKNLKQILIYNEEVIEVLSFVINFLSVGPNNNDYDKRQIRSLG